jgi:hypothetical protein
MKSFTVCLAATLLAACGASSSDEEQVRELIATMEKAAEARDASDVMEHVADEYSDDDGADKSQLTSYLRGYFLAHPKVDVTVDIESLEVPVAGLAQARLDVTVLPARDGVTLDVEFRRQDGDWRVTRADRVREP